MRGGAWIVVEELLPAARRAAWGVVGGSGRSGAIAGGRAPPAVRAVAKPPTTISQTPSIKPTTVTILLV